LVGTGASYVLDRVSDWPDPVDTLDFKTRFLPGTRILRLAWREPPDDDRFPEVSIEKVLTVGSR
jgi:hypothetical protein